MAIHHASHPFHLLVGLHLLCFHMLLLPNGWEQLVDHPLVALAAAVPLLFHLLSQLDFEMTIVEFFLVFSLKVLVPLVAVACLYYALS